MLTSEERCRVEAWRDDAEAMLQAQREQEAGRLASGRLWAATMLSLSLDTCRPILRGDPVLARQLDAVVLRRALRGEDLPPAGGFIQVTVEMLDAVAEAGPLQLTEGRT
jgi:hypothetical protein